MRDRITLTALVMALLICALAMPTTAQIMNDQRQPTARITIEVPQLVADQYNDLPDFHEACAYGTGNYIAGDTLNFSWFAWCNSDGYLQFVCTGGFSDPDIQALKTVSIKDDKWDARYDSQKRCTWVGTRGMAFPKTAVEKRAMVDNMLTEFNKLNFIDGMVVNLYFP